MRSKPISPLLIAALAVAASTFSPAVRAHAQESVLYTFPGGLVGSLPESNLTLDSAGNLYGTTLLGGSGSNCGQIGNNCGTVYQLSHGTGGWIETVLAKFDGDTNGGDLFKGVVQDATGNFYGAAPAGGIVGDCNGPYYNFGGCGVIYKLSRDAAGQWRKTTIYSFTGSTDGANPASNLIIDAAGNLYGTTQAGGNLSGCSKIGCGVAFRLSHTPTGWHERVLHAFGAAEAHSPYPSGLVQDAAGNVYGTTFNSGNPACSFGCGTVFELSPTASGPWTASTLYTFTGGTDGALPVADLILDAAGNLYGTTEEGGANNDGVVFELSASGGSWTETVLYSFTGGDDGRYPRSGVLFDPAGNLYGATYFGGITVFCVNGCGAIYKLSPSGGGWVESNVYTFQGNTDGYNPSGLVRDSAGNLYGSASGGNNGNGEVFKVIP